MMVDRGDFSGVHGLFKVLALTQYSPGRADASHVEV
jgi:hypothetical protein